MKYIFLVVDADCNPLAAFPTQQEADEYVYEQKVEWGILDPLELYTEQVEYYS